MKKLLTPVLGAAMLLLMAGVASAFVSYPNGSCPDTLTIFGLKSVLNTVGPCNPQTGAAGAIGDTILGVKGIITGFDEIATGYDIFIQNSQGGPNSGIDVFTGGTNLRAPYGFNIGDSISVEFARVSIFNGDTELQYPNNLFSGPNIILRKINSGNALPPFFVGNTTDLNELPSNATFAPLVSALITLTGPVRVARVGSPGGDTKLGFHGMLVVRDAAPSDSVFIDLGKLTAIVPPAVGTILTSVSGIGNRNARGFRIMPRSAADVIDFQPPGVTDAYAIVDNQYRVVFDRNVTTASATNTSNYSLASFGTVNSAVMDGQNAVILTVTTSLVDGNPETITVTGVVGQANGIAITTPVNANFLAGLQTTGEISAPNPDSLAATPCRDVSRYIGSPVVGVGSGVTGQYSNGPFGPRSTISAIVTGAFGNLYYMEDVNPKLPGSSHRGVTAFAPPTALTVGHQYVLAGAAEEFYSENEFAAIAYVRDVGTPGVPAAIPLTVAIASLDTCDAGQNIESGRDYLSELVMLPNVKVVQSVPNTPTSGFFVAGPSPTYADTIFIENLNAVLGANSASNPNYPALGSVVNVTGVMHYTTNTSFPSFRVCPRTPSDITTGTAGVNPTSLKLAFSVFPNPARTVNIAFTLPASSVVHLGVYDLLGRQVADLANGTMAAGTYSRAWDGRDFSGAKAHSGVYFYRLRAGNEVRTARTMLIAN